MCTQGSKQTWKLKEKAFFERQWITVHQRPRMNYNDKSTLEDLGMKGEKQMLWCYLFTYWEGEANGTESKTI